MRVCLRFVWVGAVLATGCFLPAVSDEGKICNVGECRAPLRCVFASGQSSGTCQRLGCEGRPLPCELSVGVCEGKERVCQSDGGYEPVCSAASYGADFEVTETRCDGRDNDCDDQIDRSRLRLMVPGAAQQDFGWSHVEQRHHLALAGDGGVWVYRFTDDLRPEGEAQKVTSGSAAASLSTAGVDRATVVAWWVPTDAGTGAIHLARVGFDGRVSESVLQSPSVGSSVRMAAIPSSGRSLVVWSDLDGGTWGALNDRDAGWFLPMVVGPAGTSDPADIKMLEVLATEAYDRLRLVSGGFWVARGSRLPGGTHAFQLLEAEAGKNEGTREIQSPHRSDFLRLSTSRGKLLASSVQWLPPPNPMMEFQLRFDAWGNADAGLNVSMDLSDPVDLSLAPYGGNKALLTWTDNSGAPRLLSLVVDETGTTMPLHLLPGGNAAGARVTAVGSGGLLSVLFFQTESPAGLVGVNICAP